MGASKQAKQVNANMQGELNRLGSEYGGFNADRSAALGDAQQRSDLLLREALNRYQGFLNSPGFGTEGISPEARAGYLDFSRTGGLSPENITRMRGKGVFDEYATTGGLSDEDRANLRARGTATIPSFYKSYQNQLTRDKALMGGRAPGFDAQQALLAREQAQAGQDAALNAETDIIDRVNQGRQWGASSLSDAERAVAAALQQGKMFGISGLSDADRFTASQAAQNRALNLDAIRGIQSLRTDTPGEVALYQGALQGGLGQGAAARGNIIGQQAAYNPNKSWWERVGQPVLGAATGVASTIASGGFGNIGSKVSGLLNRRGPSSAGSDFSSYMYGPQIKRPSLNFAYQ